MNVVVLVVDALRADRVGALGGKEITPHVDALATDATVFENAFSTTNATDSAVTTIRTGKYPLSHGIVNHGRHVSDDGMQRVENVPQIQQILNEAGYRTAKFGRPLGRWHRKGFGVYPTEMEKRKAFDAEPDTGAKARLKRELERIHPGLKVAATKLYQVTGRKIEDSLTASEQPDDDIRSGDPVIQNFKGFVGDSSPFYAFVHLMDTHTPYNPDPELVCENLNQFDYDVKKIDEIERYVPEDFQRQIESGEYPEIRRKYYYDGTPTSAVVDAHYDAAVREADERVGRIYSILQEQGLLDDTLLVFLSDHGESLTEHGIYWDHHGLYDVSIHVPLIVQPPDRRENRIDDLVQITDIAPTIASYLDIDGIDSDGQSLRPAIEGNGDIDRDFVMAEEALYQRRRAVRTRESKLIYSLVEGDVCRLCSVTHAPDVEFYDLSDDREERNNIAEYQTEDVDALREYANQQARQYEQSSPDATTSATVSYEDEEEVYERLEALGYR